MATELRKTGISVVGDARWGTHFCHFYQTKQDLIDTLVPYFKAGLESKEFCLWVVSDDELITVDEAKRALSQAVPDLERHISDESIEILSGHDWYFEQHALNLEKAKHGWDVKLKRALARGYEGLRVSADTFWLREKDWKDFCAYEKQVNDWITAQPMTVLCTYPLAKSGAAEVLDVVQAHQFAIARRQGEWEVIEGTEPIQAKAEIKRLNKALQTVAERTPKTSVILRYGVAVLSVAAALLIAEWMESVLQSAPHVSLLLCAVMLSAWFGGVRPGLLAIALSLLAFAYVLPPNNSLTFETREIPRLLIFALSALFVGFLSAAQRSKAESLRRARDILDETVQELKRTNEALRTENAERKHTEALLNAKEQEFRAIVENAPDHIIRYDRELRRAYVNPAVARAYGLPREALIGKPIGSVIEDVGLDVKEDELTQLRQQIANVFASGQSYEYELEWPLPNGRLYFSVRLFPEFDLNGSVVNVLGISRDITERKLAEKELEKEKEILGKIFDNIPVMIGFVGDDGLRLVNPEWERTMGWTLKELQEQSVDIFAEAYPDPTYRQKVLDFVAASTGEWVDLKIKVRDGRVIDAACAVVHLSDGTRVAIARDITERKQAEEAIDERLRFETLLTELSAAFANLTSNEVDGEIDKWLQNLAEFLGVDRASFLQFAEDWKMLYRSHSYTVPGIEPLPPAPFGIKDQFPWITNHLRRGNTVKWSRIPDDMPEEAINEKKYAAKLGVKSGLNIPVIMGGSVVCAITFTSMVTYRDWPDAMVARLRLVGEIFAAALERKRAEERIRATSQQLRALSASVQSAKEEEGTRIARELHDELGGALTSLKWDLESCYKVICESDDQSLLQAWQGKFEAMLRLSETTIRAVRRISSELRPSVLDDLGLAEAIEWQAREFQARTGIVCHCDCPIENVDLNKEESTAVFRILQEALTNILRHAEATRVDIAFKKEAGGFVVTIRDNGKGITEDDQSGLQSLGLLGMRERAHLIGGEVDIIGVGAQGTVVTVRVPNAKRR